MHIIDLFINKQKSIQCNKLKINKACHKKLKNKTAKNKKQEKQETT